MTHWPPRCPDCHSPLDTEIYHCESHTCSWLLCTSEGCPVQYVDVQHGRALRRKLKA